MIITCSTKPPSQRNLNKIASDKSGVVQPARVPNTGTDGQISAKSNRRNSSVFCKWLYRYRNRVERFFNKLKQFRGIATRYDKNPNNFLAAIKLASVRIWIKTLRVLRSNWLYVP